MTTIKVKATTTFSRVYEAEVFDGDTVEETVALEQGIYDNEPLDTAVERYMRSPEQNDKTVVELVDDTAGEGQQPDVVAVEPLEGPEPSPGYPGDGRGALSGAGCA